MVIGKQSNSLIIGSRSWGKISLKWTVSNTGPELAVVLDLNDDSVTTIPSSNIELIITEMIAGINMTFGSSLDNAKIYLIQAMMDIKDNSIDGALMQLNMTSNSIKMHGHEMTEVMFIINNIK